jgi:hypothetical protein
MNLPPPPLPSDDEHSDNNDTDDHDDTHHNHHHHHHHNLVHHPAPNTTTANNATISAAVVVASTDSSSKATTNNTNTKITTAANTNTNNNNNNNNNKNGSLEFDDVSSGDSDSSDGAPLPPPGHVPPPLPDSETPPLPDSSLLGPTPPLPPDRSVPSVPPVLPPVTSPQDTLTQTTSTTAARSCSGCALSIAPEEKHYEFRMSDEEVFYHVACFACIDCGMALEPQTFKTRGAAVYCATHFAERFFPRCGGCNEPITTDVFSVALGKSWHKGHFKCFECGKQLQTDFVADELQRPFCDAECFDEHNDNEENDNDDNDDDQDDDNDVHEDMDD